MKKPVYIFNGCNSLQDMLLRCIVGKRILFVSKIQKRRKWPAYKYMLHEWGTLWIYQTEKPRIKIIFR